MRASTDSLSVSWRASAGSEWQDKYADYTDMSLVNSFADTLISYATMWYQYATRGDEGELVDSRLCFNLDEYVGLCVCECVGFCVHINTK